MPWRERVFVAFESFWDGEAPRIGESGAKGWAATTDDDLPPEGAPAMTGDALAEMDPSARVYERWASAERAAAVSSRRPARATDPEMDASDDPYRVVLFDDIKPFLFLLSSRESSQQLAYAFLAFLGLPFVPPDVPTSTPFTTDPFVHSELVERPGLLRRFWPPKASAAPFGVVGGEAMEPERSSALTAPWAVPFKAMPATVDSLFAGAKPGWFRTLAKDDLQDIDVELTRSATISARSTETSLTLCALRRNALALLRQALPDDTFLTLDALSLEAVQGPKACAFSPSLALMMRTLLTFVPHHSAVKLAKQVLRDKRNDLALWDGYARVERQRGKTTEARQVYCTALSMYRSFRPQDQIDGPLLWRAWAEMEWEEGRPVVALKVLTAATSAENVDLGALLFRRELRVRHLTSLVPVPNSVPCHKRARRATICPAAPPRAAVLHARARGGLPAASDAGFRAQPQPPRPLIRPLPIPQRRPRRGGRRPREAPLPPRLCGRDGFGRARGGAHDVCQATVPALGRRGRVPPGANA